MNVSLVGACRCEHFVRHGRIVDGGVQPDLPL